MDATRFDNLARSLERLGRRRLALGALGGGLATLLTRAGLPDTAAKKKRKHKKKKLKKNEFGCVNVGGKCRGKDSACCSGVCEGKKPKNGQKDKSRCVAHNALNCPPGADACQLGVAILCGSQNGKCFQTTGQASFCGVPGGDCVACRKDTDCEALGYGAGAACVVCDNCAAAGGTGCNLPVAV